MYARFAVIGLVLLLASGTAFLAETDVPDEDLHELMEELPATELPWQDDEPRERETPRNPQPAPTVPATPDVTEVTAKVDDLISELEIVFGDIENRVNELQESIHLELPEEEPEEMETQSTVAPAPEAKWYEQPAVWVAAAVAGGGMATFFWVSGSSAAATGVRKPVFSPLFTRFEGQKVLEHPRRAELYSVVAEKPGVRLQDLCDETQLSRTAVTHHLRLLEQQHVIVSKRVGRSRHFYENGGRYATHQKDAYALLQNDRSRDIMDLIRSEPGIIQKQICEGLGLQASIAHWHIKRLTEAGLVDPIKQGRTVQYFANSVA